MTNPEIAQAVADRAAVTQFTLPGEMTTDAAYAWQDAYVEGVGIPVGGFKLAVNGAAQMAHFGVSEGASARIFGPEIYDDGAALPRKMFGTVSVEPELCAVLGDAVADVTSPIDRETAMACIDRFHAAIEIIDQRGFAVPALKLQQAIALNVFSAGIVLGRASVAPDALDLSSLRATLSLNGEMVGDVTNAAPQEPIEAVRWLINHCLRRGVALRPGLVVMCGTHIPIRLLEEDERAVEISMTGLGKVGFTLTA